ncbi:sugar ABC transporter ATP-binding protein [Blautia schinkii]|nr:sugar ABC transporter ATP-binding protein [Blautia schinkii]
MADNSKLEDYILETKNISKEFPGVVALKDVSIEVKRGTVHALLGENGAGKSTLVKIISGVYSQTSGQIFVNGKEIEKITPKLAMDLKIAVIHQELNLVPQLTVAENVFVGREMTTKYGTIDYKEMHRQTEKLLDQFKINLNPKEKVSELSIADQQIVEIIKVLSLDTDIIIMDEPTDVLTDNEITQLFEIVHRLRETGTTIIYITHRLNELEQICDDFTILRDGQFIRSGKIKEYTQRDIVSLMVGHNVDNQFPYEKSIPGEEVLRLENCTREGVAENISFSIRKGEAVGFAGLVGAGRSELARCIFGADRFDQGNIYVDGKKVSIHSVRDAIKNGIYYTTENRKEDGLYLSAAVDFNMTISCIDDILSGKVIRKSMENSLTQDMKQKLAVKTPHMKALIKNLSGGNQQKVIFARALLTQPKIIILDEPTRGIDVGAKTEIYKIINTLKAEGNAVIVISSELPELMGICDRILVLHEGKLSGEFSKEDATEPKIMQCAFGISEVMENA